MTAVERRLASRKKVEVKRIVLPPSWQEKFVTENNGHHFRAGQHVKLVVTGVVKTVSAGGLHCEIQVESVQPFR